MGKTAIKKTLTTEERTRIKQLKQELMESGITDTREQAQYIQEEISTFRVKQQDEKRRNSWFNRFFSKIKVILSPIFDKFVKKIIMRNQPDMEQQFRQMFENPGEFQEENGILTPIYDQFKDQSTEALQNDNTFLDDRPKPKKKPVFFDDEQE